MSRICFLFAFLILAFPCSASTITVDNDGPADFDNIQTAIDSAINGDTIIVQPGIYTGNGNRDIDFKGKAITVQSTDPNDQTIVETTIINCQGTSTENHCGFYFQHSENSSSVLDGITVTNGYASYGGAICCSGSSYPKITKCILAGNHATSRGGGLHSSSSNMIISQCTVIGNISDDDGGGISYFGDSSVRNCVIANNYAPNDGGGFYALNCHPTLISCTVTGNTGDSYGGGGIEFYGGHGIISNCIVWGNNIGKGGPQNFDGAAVVSYSNIGGGHSGVGNIDIDPVFINPAAGNFRLGDSPCINTGDPNYIPEPNETDLDSNPRIKGSRIDMGAFEFQGNSPIIRSLPNQLTFIARLGGPNPEPQIISVQNVGPDSLNWHTDEDSSWLIVEPNSGLSTGDIDTATVSVDISGLNKGKYEYNLAVSDFNATNNPQIIAITLYIGTELLVPDQYNTIQDAIDAAGNYDVVIVAPGTYTGTGNRDIDFKGKAVTVCSTNPDDPGVTAATIVDCQATSSDRHRAFNFISGEGPDSVLYGLTITGSYAESGAIYCKGSPTINHCVIKGNYGVSWGGGIRIDGSSPKIIESVIRNNSVGGAYAYGGAIYGNGNPVIQNCVIEDNTVAHYGGGIMLTAGNARIQGCFIKGNSAHLGGGIYCEGGTPIIIDCIITNNSVGHNGGGLFLSCAATVEHCTITNNSTGYKGAGIYSSSGTKVSNCIIWGNNGSEVYDNASNITYSNVEDGYPGMGNINIDPLFVNPNGDDYHLSANSFCINSGDPTYVSDPCKTDIDGEPRVINGRTDMGADEFNYSGTILGILPAVFNYSAYRSGLNPPVQSLSIRNLGSGEITWQININENCLWLDAAPTSGTSADDTNEVTFSVNTSGLSAGTYSCEAIVSAEGALNNPQTVAVHLNVLEPIISVTPGQIEFSAPEGLRNPDDKVLGISNGGTGTLTWTLSPDCNWLRINPTSGSSSGETDSVIISADINGLLPGYYTAALTVVGEYAANSPVIVPVALNVSAPYIKYEPCNLTFFAVGNSQPPAEQLISIKNGGGGILQWSVVADCNWLSISPQEGETTSEVDQITVIADVNGLTPKDYNGVVTISSDYSTNSPQSIAVHLFVHIAGQEILYVPEQFSTIQEAIDVALDGDTVVVAEGVYSGAGNHDLDFAGKAITVRSTDPNDPNIVATTIIDCNGTAEEPHGGFYFHSGEDGNSILKGLTVKNGYVYNGGGVYCGGASPTISNCNFIDCSAENWGGGIFCYEAYPVISECNFTGNSAREGGAITTYSYWDILCSPLIKNCTMSDNYGSTDGGAFDSDCLSSPIISNCLIINNHSGNLGGGGIAIWQSTPTIQNCVIADNYTNGQGSGILQAYEFGDGSKIINCVITQSNGYNNYGPGIYCSSKMLVKNSILGGNTDLFPGGIIASSGSDVNFAYCDAINSGGSGPSWHVPMVKDGGGNIDAEPQFANTLNNDYHLKSAAGRWDPNSERWVRDSITSPCIDAGDPNSDWTAELWPHGKRINIGAYGGTAEASMSLSALGNIANLDNDPEEIVDIFDIAIFASQWCLRDMPLSADIDRNGRVDFLDFAALFHVFTVASNWWKFDEGTGTIAHDFAGTNNGTIYGATWTTGKIAGALSFNGTSNYVGCGSGASNYDNITVSAWMKTSANGVLVSNRYNSGSYGTWYTLSSTGIEIGDNSQGGYRSVTFNASTLNGLWHHIVYTKDGTSHAIYVDGSLDRSFTSNADISWSQPLYIGKRWNRTSNIGWFNGIIDDVRIYNRALSAGEVAQLYEEAN